MTEKRIYSNLAIPPGEFLEEVIDDLGITKEEFANRMNRPAAKLSHIFSGKKAITANTALQIEKVTNVPAHIWTGLESEYRLTLARLELQKEEKLKSEIELVPKFCYAALVKHGLVEKFFKGIEKVRELHKYFGVTSLSNLTDMKRYAPLYRRQKGDRHKVSPEAVSSWLRMGEIEGSRRNCKPYSKAELEKLVLEIKKLTNIDVDDIKKYLEKKFANAGIALVIVPHLPKTYAHGAAFWLKDKPVIMVTIRKSWADIFWFSLLHELAHILLHGKNEVFIESDKGIYISEKKENEADKFASEKLIPAKEYKQFKAAGSFYENEIVQFASKIKVHPGIVVGRLQHDEMIEPSWHNSLRERFVWEKDN